MTRGGRAVIVPLHVITAVYMWGRWTMTATIPVTLYLDATTKSRIDALKPLGYTLNGFVRAAIAEHLARTPAPIDPESLSRLVSRA